MLIKISQRERVLKALIFAFSILLRSMPMERHRCKLCFRAFANGRALGGQAHLATLPLKPLQLVESHTESALSSSSSFGEEQEEDEQSLRDAEEKAFAYGLRENPKKSFRHADLDFSFAIDAGSVVQDRESETESKNPTHQRSKQNRKSRVVDNQGENLELKKPKLKKSSLVDSPKPLSSIFDTSPKEDVAMCLMLLSRGKWMGNNEEKDQEQGLRGAEER